MSNEREEQVDWQLMTKINEREKGLKQLCVGGALFVVGLLILAVGVVYGLRETAKPTALFRATEDAYSYTRVVYLTESFAYYDAMEGMQFYLALDSAYQPSVICLHNDDRERFQPYIDNFYGLTGEELPEYMALGYAKPFDRELQQYAMEALYGVYGLEINGEDLTDSFQNYFDGYYLQIGENRSAFRFFQVAAFCLVIGLGAIFLGMLHYRAWSDFLKVLESQGRPEASDGRKQSSRLLGVLGALLGAVMGGLLWTVVGTLSSYKFLNFWVGLILYFLSYSIYGFWRQREELTRYIAALVCSLLSMAAATYMQWTWIYYSDVNGGVFGYIPLERVLRELPSYVSDSDWKLIRFEMVGGAILVLVGFGISLSIFLEDKKQAHRPKTVQKNSSGIAEKAKAVQKLEEREL